MQKWIISESLTQAHIRCAWRHGRPGERSGGLALWCKGPKGRWVDCDVDCEVIGLHTTLSFGLLCRGHEEVHAYDSFY